MWLSLSPLSSWGIVQTQSSYPFTVYLPISSKEQDVLETQARQRTGANRVEMNFYGLSMFMTFAEPVHFTGDRPAYAFTENERLHWTHFLIQNADLFGIDNPDHFQLVWDPQLPFGPLLAYQQVHGRSFFTLSHRPSGWKAIEPSGIELVKSCVQGQNTCTVTIMGHYWPNAMLPESPKFSIEQIKHRWVNHIYESPQGPITITTENLDTALAANLDKGDRYGRTELRLVYVVTLKFNNKEVWTKVIDAMTDEEITLFLKVR
jgi:hypothetical protein